MPSVIILDPLYATTVNLGFTALTEAVYAVLSWLACLFSLVSVLSPRLPRPVLSWRPPDLVPSAARPTYPHVAGDQPCSRATAAARARPRRCRQGSAARWRATGRRNPGRRRGCSTGEHMHRAAGLHGVREPVLDFLLSPSSSSDADRGTAA